MQIEINNMEKVDSNQLDFELVERKGIGHPDTMCDAIAEKASQYYSQYCYDNFNKIAHHWFDKVMIIGGEATLDYGYGELIKPYKIIFAGKAAYRYKDIEIPLYKILHNASVDVLKTCLTGFDENKHIKIINEIVDHQGAGRQNNRYRPMNKNDLTDIHANNLVSNDCNLLSSHAPLSKLENLVLSVEKYINGKEFKVKHKDTGWDVKVFGSRTMNKFDLVVNMPFLAKYITSIEKYYSRKSDAKEDIEKYILSNFDIEINLTLNPTDRNGRPYLTVLGSVADTGDVGVVGRGNRMNGLITPMKSMSIEAPAGKNPMDHTGKLYGVLSQNIAQRIFEVLNAPVDVHIFTSKEAPLKNPDKIYITLGTDNINEQKRNIIDSIVRESIDNLSNITCDFIFEGKVMW